MPVENPEYDVIQTVLGCLFIYFRPEYLDGPNTNIIIYTCLQYTSVLSLNGMELNGHTHSLSHTRF